MFRLMQACELASGYLIKNGVAPDLDAKAGIIQNAIDLAHAMGVDELRVAILSAMETVSS